MILYPSYFFLLFYISLLVQSFSQISDLKYSKEAIRVAQHCLIIAHLIIQRSAFWSPHRPVHGSAVVSAKTVLRYHLWYALEWGEEAIAVRTKVELVVYS